MFTSHLDMKIIITILGFLNFVHLINAQSVMPLSIEPGSNSAQNIQSKKHEPVKMNGNLVYFMGDVDIQPRLSNSKDIFDSRKLLFSYVMENLMLDSLQLKELKMTVVVSKEGKIIDILFVDDYFEGVKEDIEILEKTQNKEYLIYRTNQIEKDPNKGIKEKIKQLLYPMPNWMPGKVNGENVNTWII